MIHPFIEFLRGLYVLCAVLLSVYTFGQAILLILYLKHRHEVTPLPQIQALPTVMIQLPLYNERYMVKRLLNAVAALDYPREKLTIQVLDDSDDDTSILISTLVKRIRAQGLNIIHIQRENRTGYKAGALAYGLALTEYEQTTSEFIALFDADFVPSPDFLMRTVPYFVEYPRLGIVQSRWGHLNREANLLTRAQALAIDAHFIIEQTARNRSGLMLTFNGTCGLWRTACIHDAGGWSDDTLTEDFDLSYRAQMKGWQYLFLPDLVVRGEIPPQLNAYKRQQARWAKGSNQALVKLLPYLWRSRLTWGQRIMALQHLCQYLPHPLMFVLLMLTPPLLMLGALKGLPLTPMGLIGLAPPIIHLVAQASLYDDWAKRLLAFPMVMVLGAGLVWNNTVAAWEAFSGLFTGRRGEFKRTPKFDEAWAESAYALQGNKSIWIELALTIYACIGFLAALHIDAAIAPYMGLYAVSFGIITALGVSDRWQIFKHMKQAQVKAS